VQNSIFGGNNRNIVRFIEAVCFGNMRLALQLFSTFLYSGATDVRKMLNIFDRDGSYDVPFHEFLKSIMLGDRAYYKEDASPLLNMFNVGTEKNSSHFTAYRLLRLLMTHRSESTTEGRGYVRLELILNSFEDLFDNREDLLSVLNRLVRYHLVEANTRSSETIMGASDVRITSAGWFYLRFLTKTFAYLDLVLQDTPVDDYAVHTALLQSVRDVDNMVDRDDLKLDRVRTRFARVSTFVDYLQDQETAEREGYGLTEEMGVLGETIVPAIRHQFDHDRDWIEYRIIQNRERYNDEAQFSDPDGAEQYLLREYVERGDGTTDDDPDQDPILREPN
jgi:hypothetical protein